MTSETEPQQWEIDTNRPDAQTELNQVSGISAPQNALTESKDYFIKNLNRYLQLRGAPSAEIQGTAALSGLANSPYAAKGLPPGAPGVLASAVGNFSKGFLQGTQMGSGGLDLDSMGKLSLIYKNIGGALRPVISPEQRTQEALDIAQGKAEIAAANATPLPKNFADFAAKINADKDISKINEAAQQYNDAAAIIAKGNNLTDEDGTRLKTIFTRFKNIKSNRVGTKDEAPTFWDGLSSFGLAPEIKNQIQAAQGRLTPELAKSLFDTMTTDVKSIDAIARPKYDAAANSYVKSNKGVALSDVKSGIVYPAINYPGTSSAGVGDIVEEAKKELQNTGGLSPATKAALKAKGITNL